MKKEEEEEEEAKKKKSKKESCTTGLKAWWRAGTLSLSPLFSPFAPKPCDGLVSKKTAKRLLYLPPYPLSKSSHSSSCPHLLPLPDIPPDSPTAVRLPLSRPPPCFPPQMSKALWTFGPWTARERPERGCVGFFVFFLPFNLSYLARSQRNRPWPTAATAPTHNTSGATHGESTEGRASSDPTPENGRIIWRGSKNVSAEPSGATDLSQQLSEPEPKVTAPSIRQQQWL